jgi:hypothetical protein
MAFFRTHPPRPFSAFPCSLPFAAVVGFFLLEMFKGSPRAFSFQLVKFPMIP